jgi:hypothetical protein
MWMWRRRTRRANSSAAELGKGLVAGLVGTALMTLSSTLEMKRRHRTASKAPAHAAEKVFGAEPDSEHGEEHLSNLVHFAYGMTWGMARALIARAGLRGPLAAPAHFAAVWLAGLVALPSLGLAPPPWKWGGKEVAIDALHHAVYATGTDAAFRVLSRIG